VRLAQARLEVGAGTPLDVRRAQVQQGRAQATLVQSRSNAQAAVLTLSQLLGTPVEPTVQLSTQFQVFDPQWQADELVGDALRNNPQLLAARATQEAARTSVKSARTAYLPSVGVNVGLRGSAYQAGNIDPLVAEQMAGLEGGFRACQANNDIRTRVGLQPTACLNPADPGVAASVRNEVSAANNAFPFKYTRQPLSASLSVSLPIFTGFQRTLQVDQAKAQAADAQYAVRAQELRLRQEIGTALLTMDSQHQQVLLQEQVRANAQEELRLAQERFRFGAASSIEVTDAQTTLAQAEQDLITAVYTFHRTLASLEALVGRPLR
jgi:outer membrane protein